MASLVCRFQMVGFVLLIGCLEFLGLIKVYLYIYLHLFSYSICTWICSIHSVCLYSYNGEGQNISRQRAIACTHI